MSKRKSINTTLASSSNNTSSSSSSSSSSCFTTRNNVFTTNLNFRPNSTQEDRGGTRPIAEPSSVSLVLVTMIVHVCKKSLLYNPRLKAVIYFGAIFVGSILADVAPIPKTYFAKSNNFLNKFFIKWAWGWLLTTAGPWVILTAHIIGCGRRIVLLKHLSRLLFATAAWILWMNVFHYVETNYGRCLGTKDRNLQTKSKCLQAGQFWSSLDISGHSFIIIYSSLILSEEAYSLIGWEGIKDYIMNEEYNRKTFESTTKKGYLCNISDTDLNFLKKTHKALTPYLRGLFITMTLQQIIWEVMLVATILYYHIMMEKFIGGVAAILTWYVSYHWIFKISQLGIVLPPGEGLFKYNNNESKETLKKTTTKRSLSSFMGMPIKEFAAEKNNLFKLKDNNINSELIYRKN